MLNKVVSLKPIGDFKLQVSFSDGAGGVMDFEPILASGGPVARALLEPGQFSKASLEFGAPTWPNGYDVCPDWLRMKMAEEGVLKVGIAA